LLSRISFVRSDDESGEVTAMRLIDAEKLVDMLYDNEFAVLCPLDEVSGVVDACPTVDAVPVVRCKDCKYSCKDGNGRSCEGYWYELSEYDVTVKDDDFCSYGEGKDYD
jgi:hypothetical protein